MDNIAQLGIKVDSSGVKQATTELSKLTTQSGKTEKGIDTLSAKTSILNAKNAVLAVATSATVSQLVKMSDIYTSVNSRLNLATKSTEDYTKAQQELFKIAQETKTSFEGTVDLYARIARSTESLKLSQSVLFDLTETINKTGIISGASSQQMEAGLMQLGQAFSAGALRGEELNSILEQMPRLAKAIADGMNIEVGALKSVAEEGKITSKVLIDAIKSQSSVIDTEYSIMATTIEQSSTMVGNSILVLIGKLNDATGASSDTANAIKDFSQFLDDNANAIIEWGIVAYASTSQLVDGVNLLYETLENTAQTILAGINTTVYGALSSLSGAILSVVESLDSLGIGSNGALEKAREINNSLNESYNESKKLAVDSVNEIGQAYNKASISVEDRIKMMAVEKQIAMENAEMQKETADETEKTSTKKKELTKEEIKLQKELLEKQKQLSDAYAEIAQVGLSKYDSTLVSIAEKTQKWIEAGVNINDVLAAQKQLIDELNIQQALSSASEELSFLEKKAQLMTDEYEKSKLLLEIKYAQSLIDIQGSDKPLEDKQNLIDKETELYNLTLERIELDRNTEFADTIKTFQEDALDRQIALNESMYEFGDSFDGVAKHISAASKAIINMNTISIKGKKEEDKLNEKYTKSFNKYAGDVNKTKELAIQYDKDSAQIKEQNFNAEIAGYANLAGAMASAFEKGSDGAIAFTTLQATLGIASSWTAIAMAWASAPFPLNLPAVAAASAGVLPIIGTLASMGGGGGKGGGQSYSQTQINESNIQATYTPMTDRLDRQIELLEAIEKNGSASKISTELAAVTFQKDYALFVNKSLEQLHDGIVAGWGTQQGKSGGRLANENALNAMLGFDIGTNVGEGYSIDKNALRESYNFMKLIQAANTSVVKSTDWNVLFDKGWGKYGSPLNALQARIAEFTNEFQDMLSDYTMSLLDSMDELKSAKDTFMDLYDDITGTAKYSNQKLNTAFSELQKYLNGKSLTDYLESEIENIKKLESFLTEDKINTLLMQDPTKLEEQLKIIEDLRVETGMTFENGAEDALNYLESIKLVSDAMTTSRENIRTFIDSFKSEDMLAQSLASSLSQTLATTYDGLLSLFNELSSDTTGLTDADLSLLESNKEYIIRLEEQQEEARKKELEAERDLNQAKLDDAQKTYNQIKSDISSVTSVLSSLKSTIDKLRGGADTTNTYTLDKFYESMSKTQDLLKGKDYKAIQDSLQETIGYSSALMDSKNFSLSKDMQYAQLVAASQFEAMDITLNDELDYLKMIEANTANTVDVLTQTLARIGNQISQTVNNNSDAMNALAKKMEQEALIAQAQANKSSFENKLATSTNEQLVNTIYQDVFGREADVGGLQNWLNQINNASITGISRENLLDKMLESAAESDKMAAEKFLETLKIPSFAVGTSSVSNDMMAQIHKGEIITPRNFSDGLRNGDLIMGETSSIVSAINAMNANVSNRVSNLESGLNGIISNQSSQIKIMNDTYDVNNGTLVSLQTIEKVI